MHSIISDEKLKFAIDKLAMCGIELHVMENKLLGIKTSGIIPKLIIPDGITAIESNSGMHCRVKKLVLPDSVIRIKSNAFSYQKDLEEVIGGSELAVIEESAFKYCVNIKRVDFGRCAKLSSIGKYAFCECGKLQELVLPEMASISFESSAFTDNILEEIRVPHGVFRIPNGLFRNSRRLKRVSLPDTLVSIGLRAFRNCDRLEEIVIPRNVVLLDGSVFEKCTRLKHIIIENRSKITISSNYLDSGIKFDIPEGTEVIFN